VHVLAMDGAAWMWSKVKAAIKECCKHVICNVLHLSCRICVRAHASGGRRRLDVAQAAAAAGSGAEGVAWHGEDVKDRRRRRRRKEQALRGMFVGRRCSRYSRHGEDVTHRRRCRRRKDQAVTQQLLEKLPLQPWAEVLYCHTGMHRQQSVSGLACADTPAGVCASRASKLSARFGAGIVFRP